MSPHPESLSPWRVAPGGGFGVPLETAKLHSHVVRVEGGKEIESPLAGVLLVAPVAPVHEMFEQAWRERGPA